MELFILKYKSKAGNHSQGWQEHSLLNSYYIEV